MTGDGSAYGYPTAVGDAAFDPNVPSVYPTYGAGTGALTDGGISPSVANSSGIAPSTSGGGVATNKASITAPMLVPMSDAPETYWTQTSPYLRSGDVVVAHVASESSALVTFADRIRTDAPLVTYVVAFPAPAQVESALTKGLPATLSAVGLSTTTGLNDGALASLADKVHTVGRRLFVSVRVPTDGPTLAAVGARADLVELVIAGANGTELAREAKAATTSIGNKPRVFVRLPTALTSTSTAPSATSAIVTAVPNAGVAFPASPKVSDYRTR